MDFGVTYISGIRYWTHFWPLRSEWGGCTDRLHHRHWGNWRNHPQLLPCCGETMVPVVERNVGGIHEYVLQARLDKWVEFTHLTHGQFWRQVWFFVGTWVWPMGIRSVFNVHFSSSILHTFANTPHRNIVNTLSIFEGMVFAERAASFRLMALATFRQNWTTRPKRILPLGMAEHLL